MKVHRSSWIIADSGRSHSIEVRQTPDNSALNTQNQDWYSTYQWSKKERQSDSLSWGSSTTNSGSSLHLQWYFWRSAWLTCPLGSRRVVQLVERVETWSGEVIFVIKCISSDFIEHCGSGRDPLSIRQWGNEWMQLWSQASRFDVFNIQSIIQRTSRRCYGDSTVNRMRRTKFIAIRRRLKGSGSSNHCQRFSACYRFFESFRFNGKT